MSPQTYDFHLVKQILDKINELMVKNEELRLLCSSAVGETRNAYDTIVSDIQWKIQQKIWQLAYYFGGDDQWGAVLRRNL